jgi:uncharacterized membrane-anchored protein
VAASLVLLGAAPAAAQVDKKEARQREAEAVLRSIAWEKGPTKSSVGDQGEIQVPEGYVFTGGPGTRKMLELMQNPTSGTELGLLAPVNFGWFLIFEFSSIGYVKDADKEKLDSDDILESIRRGTEESNKQRKARNWPTITIVGWQTAPFFDNATKNLQWCIKGSSAGHEIVNYNTRVLGRHGVMSANLLVAPDKLEASLPTVKSLIAGFSFKEGKRYSEYKKGDRIAEYGLAALVVGGAAAAAAKLGFFGKLFAMLGKLWKLVVVGLVALVGGLKTLLGFRKKSTPVPSGGAGRTGGEGEGGA